MKSALKKQLYIIYFVIASCFSLSAFATPGSDAQALYNQLVRDNPGEAANLSYTPGDVIVYVKGNYTIKQNITVPIGVTFFVDYPSTGTVSTCTVVSGVTVIVNGTLKTVNNKSDKYYFGRVSNLGNITIGSSGNVSIDGGDILNGDVAGAGTFTNNGTINVTGEGSIYNGRMSTGTMTNNGTITVIGTNSRLVNAYGTYDVAGTGTFTNSSTGIINVNDDARLINAWIDNSANATSTFTNAGSINLNGGWLYNGHINPIVSSAYKANATFNNTTTGVIEVKSTTTAGYLLNGYGNNTSIIANFTNGGLIVNDTPPGNTSGKFQNYNGNTLTNEATGKIINNGTMVLGTTAITNNAGVIDMNVPLNTVGGTQNGVITVTHAPPANDAKALYDQLVTDNPAEAANLSYTPGDVIVYVKGNYTIKQNITVPIGVTFYVDYPLAQPNINICTVASGVDFTVNGTLKTVNNKSDERFYGRISNHGNIIINSTGKILIDGGDIINGDEGGDGTFTNNGIIDLTGHGNMINGSNGNGTMINNGTINIIGVDTPGNTFFTNSSSTGASSSGIFTNSSTGIINVTNVARLYNASINNTANATGTFTNAGQINLDGGWLDNGYTDPASASTYKANATFNNTTTGVITVKSTTKAGYLLNGYSNNTSIIANFTNGGLIVNDTPPGNTSGKFQNYNGNTLTNEATGKIINNGTMVLGTTATTNNAGVIDMNVPLNTLGGTQNGVITVTEPAPPTLAVDVPLPNDFRAIAYPNSFNDTFTIDVNTSNQSPLNIKVYDMLGRLIEQREVVVLNNTTTIKMGQNYFSGIYNVILQQEKRVKTFRMIKR
ncbi:T9SS type A sorting domain-containing protein [Flavobacterium sp.]|uniref:T9SS type A sorting domain-containing protein n=1 Tax=Flavobacterium sp. TaxID=239 RepID=UPI002C881909|nr:T9SS type A sorting domain-containing protein [Flavobacterium sp.]HSD05650.1 T9SS type A sorting domain-containing protein [Flavobacterium sp.]